MADLAERIRAVVEAKQRLARAVTSGLWESDGVEVRAARTPADHWLANCWESGDAAFIAANSPASVLTGLAEDLAVLDRHRRVPL